ncbi:MAG: DUF2203 domain-containing protein [Chloroflexi bacterium]|nr:DUF2203 domain-containing protein [Chloroflexota bacterium]
MRLYQLDEARALLPRVVPVLRRLQATLTEYRAVQASIQALARGSSGDGHALADPWAEGGEDRVEALEEQLREAVGQLDGWGIEVKDPARGLIDFYWEREGEVVYLCYLLGEPEIAFWHTLSAGFAGRQPVE